MLPSVHDHSLIEYRVHLRARQVTLITRPEATRSSSADQAAFTVDAVATVFEGLEAHPFERVAAGVILSEIAEPPLGHFLSEHEREFTEGHRLVGAPSWWRGTLAAAEVYLRDRGTRVFEIHSSYGFSGWVLASSVHQAA